MGAYAITQRRDTWTAWDLESGKSVVLPFEPEHCPVCSLPLGRADDCHPCRSATPADRWRHVQWLAHPSHRSVPMMRLEVAR